MASSNSLLIVPRASHSKAHLQTTHSAPSVPGLHDTLRGSLVIAGESNLVEATSGRAPQQSAHPLSSRLAQFSQTQRSLHLTLLRRQYGLAAPLIREMEVGVVRAEESVKSRELSFGPGMGLGSVSGGRGRSVHEEVLLGKDWEIDGWEDVFAGGNEFAQRAGFHTEMEHRLRMGW